MMELIMHLHKEDKIFISSEWDRLQSDSEPYAVMKIYTNGSGVTFYLDKNAVKMIVKKFNELEKEGGKFVTSTRK